MTNIVKFITSTKDEVQKVSWPNKQEVTNLTTYVIGVSLTVGIFVSVFDLVFKELLTLILIKWVQIIKHKKIKKKKLGFLK